MDHGHAKMTCPMLGFGVIDDPKNGLSYMLNTENTKTDIPPPLTPPPEPHARQKKEEEEEEKSQKDKKREEARTSLQPDDQDDGPDDDSEDHREGKGFFEQLLDVWNEVIQTPLYGTRVFLSPERIQKFRHFLDETPVGDFSAWRDYCQQIRRTGFLIDENESGFRASLDWALDPGNARKVLEGAFYTKPHRRATTTTPETRSESSWHQHVAALKQHCEIHGYDPHWLEVCKFLSVTLGIHTFENWFKEMRPRIQADGTLHLTVKNLFFRDHIMAHYEIPLKKAILASFSPSTRFEIRCGEPDYRENSHA